MRTAYRTCPLCEATCGLELTIDGERVEVVRGDRENVFSHGFICPKGTTLGKLHDDPDRLRSPMIRRGESWEETSWDEAYAFIDAAYQRIVDRHGRDAAAVYLGNPNVHSLDNALAVRPFVKALGTRNVYSASSVDQMPKHVSAGLMFGHPLAIPVPDVDRTAFLLLLGANPIESNGSLATAPDWPGRLEALGARHGMLVVVDPRRTKTAEMADLHVPIRPGTDAAFLCAIINHLFANHLVRLGDLAGRVDGVDEVAKAVEWFTPSRVSDFCGVSAATIEAVALDLAAASSACVYGRIGTHTVEHGTVASWAVDVLNVLTGNLDSPGGAMFPAAAHLPANRPARSFRTGRWRSRVRDLPEVIGELPVVTLADEITTPGDGQVRALFVVAGNPALTTPDAGRLAAALEGLDLLVSVDPYLNETSRHADVILPPPSALERPHYDMSFTGLSLRNYAMFSEAVFPTDAPSEFDILVALTAIVSGLGPDADPAALAAADLDGRVQRVAAGLDTDPEEIRRRLATWDDPRLAALDLMLRTGAYGDGFGRDPDGLTLARLRAAPHGIDFGALRPRLAEAIATESGRVRLAPEPIIADLPRLKEAVRRRPDDRMVLVGRRQLRTANSWLGNVEVLVKGREQCTLQVNTADALRLGLGDGDTAVVTSDTGRVEAPVEVTDGIRPGVVSLPCGWGHDVDGVELSVATEYPGVNVNLITDGGRFDPLSGNAALNAVPVTVAAV